MPKSRIVISGGEEMINRLKPFLKLAATFYFGLALILQVFILIKIIIPESDLSSVNPFLGFSEGVFAFLGLGFVVLWIATILTGVSKSENGGGFEDEFAEPQKRSKPNLFKILTVLFFLNAGISFFMLGSATRDGEPKYRDGRYALVRRGEVIREIDRNTYYEASRSYRNAVAQVAASFFLVFTWGAFAVHMQRDQKDSD